MDCCCCCCGCELSNSDSFCGGCLTGDCNQDPLTGQEVENPGSDISLQPDCNQDPLTGQEAGSGCDFLGRPCDSLGSPGTGDGTTDTPPADDYNFNFDPASEDYNFGFDPAADSKRPASIANGGGSFGNNGAGTSGSQRASGCSNRPVCSSTGALSQLLKNFGSSVANLVAGNNRTAATPATAAQKKQSTSALASILPSTSGFLFVALLFGGLLFLLAYGKE